MPDLLHCWAAVVYLGYCHGVIIVSFGPLNITVGVLCCGLNFDISENGKVHDGDKHGTKEIRYLGAFYWLSQQGGGS